MCEASLRPGVDVVVGQIDTRAGYDHWSRTYDDESNRLLVAERPVIGVLLVVRSSSCAGP